MRTGGAACDVAAAAAASSGRPAEAEMRYTVAVDCDGVIHSYSSGWQGADLLPDPPVPGAIDWLNEIIEKFDVVIHTTRGDQPGGNAAVLAYLREHGYVGPDLVVRRSRGAHGGTDGRLHRRDRRGVDGAAVPDRRRKRWQRRDRRRSLGRRSTRTCW